MHGGERGGDAGREAGAMSFSRVITSLHALMVSFSFLTFYVFRNSAGARDDDADASQRTDGAVQRAHGGVASAPSDELARRCAKPYISTSEATLLLCI